MCIRDRSQGSPTRPDAKTKIGIALKEMRESSYFLRIFNQLKLGDIAPVSYTHLDVYKRQT